MRWMKRNIKTIFVYIFLIIFVGTIYVMGWNMSGQTFSSYNRDKLAAMKHLLHID